MLLASLLFTYTHTATEAHTTVTGTSLDAPSN